LSDEENKVMTEELNTTGESTATESAPATAHKSNKLVLQGKVVSDKMDKTIVVEVEYLKKHRLYKKAIRRHNRFKAHDEDNTSHVGDIVRIEECRPYSKEKTWRLVEIVQKGVVL
jgi:small subunit ribosomal protein S17